MGMNPVAIWMGVVIVWAFAEATLFFVVPDVALTFGVLLFGAARALRAAGCAALAAAAGGLVMYRWGAADPDAARAALLAVPLVGGDLLDRVADEIAGFWPLHLTMGAITGAPYKIYAVAAGETGVDPLSFAVVSVMARFARFALAIGLAALLFRLGRRLGLHALLLPGLMAAWAAIYAVYIFIRTGAA